MRSSRHPVRPCRMAANSCKPASRTRSPGVPGAALSGHGQGRTLGGQVEHWPRSVDQRVGGGESAGNPAQLRQHPGPSPGARNTSVSRILPFSIRGRRADGPDLFQLWARRAASTGCPEAAARSMQAVQAKPADGQRSWSRARAGSLARTVWKSASLSRVSAGTPAGRAVVAAVERRLEQRHVVGDQIPVIEVNGGEVTLPVTRIKGFERVPLVVRPGRPCRRETACGACPWAPASSCSTSALSPLKSKPGDARAAGSVVVHQARSTQ